MDAPPRPLAAATDGLEVAGPAILAAGGRSRAPGVDHGGIVAFRARLANIIPLIVRALRAWRAWQGGRRRASPQGAGGCRC
ncbi:hypothetical protein [Polymorphospora lycopeni]|uniref:Uncharacterized protein n=1 Tax=Polymorphospora lycopeni TaxID=3140240 RepID=A0ABV5D1N3_9ACTN